MKTYTDPVFMPSECNRKDILAAYDPEYHKAMIISDTGIEGNSVIKKGQEVSVIYPAASTKEEQTEIVKKHTDHYGVKVNQAVLGNLALVEFYKSQGKITSDDVNVITVETYMKYTDVSLLTQDGEVFHICEKERIPEGDGNLDRAATVSYRTAAAVNRMGQKTKTRGSKILLSGSFWNMQEHVESLKDKLPDNTVYAYKPAHAMALGGSIFLKKYGRHHPTCRVPEHFPSYHCTSLPTTQLQKLSPLRQKMYDEKLDAIKQKKEEVLYTGPCTAEDIRIVQQSLFEDHPEIDFIYNYNKGTLWQVKKNGNAYIEKETLAYKTDKMFERISAKADENIRKAMKGRILTDEEIVRAVYEYMAKNYHYTTESLDKEGRFPAYTYTLEGSLLSAGVCAAYSQALVYMLSVKLQIPCQYVVGKVSQRSGIGSHAWDIVQESTGEYRLYDLTFDLGKKEFEYFCKEDLEFRVRGHILDSKANYPACR